VFVVVVVMVATGLAAALALTDWIGGGHERAGAPNPRAGPGAPSTTAPGSGLEIPRTTTPATTRDPALWPFATDSPWNTPLGSRATFDSREVASDGEINASNGFGVSVGGAGYPLVDQATGRPDQESHYSFIDPERMVAEEWYEYQNPANPNRNSSITDLRGDGLHTTVAPGTGRHHQQRASQVSQLGGLIRVADIQRGVIPHALALALPDRTLRNGYVWPAFGQDGDAAVAYHGFVPMGSLVAIPSWVPMPSGLSRVGQMIWYALSHYGAYVVDRTTPSSVLMAEAAADPLVDPARNDMTAIMSQVRLVTNSDRTQVGGPGTRLAPWAPALR